MMQRAAGLWTYTEAYCTSVSMLKLYLCDVLVLCCRRGALAARGAIILAAEKDSRPVRFTRAIARACGSGCAQAQ